MSKTRAWIAVFRRLPTDLQADETFLSLMQAEDGEGIIDYLNAGLDAAIEEERTFVDAHPRLAHQSSRSVADFDYSRSLSDDVAKEVDWFDEECRSRRERIRILREAIRYAKDVAGVEPYFRPESEDE